jgi:hypothetical protein
MTATGRAVDLIAARAWQALPAASHAAMIAECLLAVCSVWIRLSLNFFAQDRPTLLIPYPLWIKHREIL